MISILVGFTAGLGYGWGINPADRTGTTPRTLRIDYKTDAVLMASELYCAEDDLALGLDRLAFLDDSPPLEIINEAISYAKERQYAPEDIQCMLNLAAAIQHTLPAIE